MLAVNENETKAAEQRNESEAMEFIPLPVAAKRFYVDRYTATIERTDLYLVRVTAKKGGKIYEDLEPRRLFPVTNPDMYITLLDKDEKEVAFVRDFKELDEASADALRACFADYYRIPRITAITKSEYKFGILFWSTETDHGPVRFRIANVRHDLLRMGDRVLIRDSNDNRYEIPDVKQLDKQSASILFAWM